MMLHCFDYQTYTKGRDSQTFHLQHLFSGHFQVISVRILGLVISAGKPRPSHFFPTVLWSHSLWLMSHNLIWHNSTDIWSAMWVCFPIRDLWDKCCCDQVCCTKLKLKETTRLKQVFWIWQHNLVFFSSPWWKKLMVFVWQQNYDI